jgi:hypothetical protein
VGRKCRRARSPSTAPRPRRCRDEALAGHRGGRRSGGARRGGDTRGGARSVAGRGPRPRAAAVARARCGDGGRGGDARPAARDPSVGADAGGVGVGGAGGSPHARTPLRDRRPGRFLGARGGQSVLRPLSRGARRVAVRGPQPHLGARGVARPARDLATQASLRQPLPPPLRLRLDQRAEPGVGPVRHRHLVAHPARWPPSARGGDGLCRRLGAHVSLPGSRAQPDGLLARGRLRRAAPRPPRYRRGSAPDRHQSGGPHRDRAILRTGQLRGRRPGADGEPHARPALGGGGDQLPRPGRDAVRNVGRRGAARAPLRLADAVAVPVRAAGLESRGALAALGDLQPQALADAGLLSARRQSTTPQPERPPHLPGERAAPAHRMVRLEVLGDRPRRLARPDRLLSAPRAAGLWLSVLPRPARGGPKERRSRPPMVVVARRRRRRHPSRQRPRPRDRPRPRPPLRGPLRIDRALPRPAFNRRAPRRCGARRRSADA